MLSSGIRFFILVPLFLVLTASGNDVSNQADIEKLQNRFAFEVKHATEALSLSKIGSAAVYWLTFGTENIEQSHDRIGKILKAYPMQAERIEKTIAEANFSEIDRKDATNNIVFKVGFEILERRIANSCRSCKTDKDKQEFRRGARDFMKIFDFQDQDFSPSALIFYDTIKEKFQDPTFIKRTIALRDELNKIIHRFAENKLHVESEVLFDVALRVCNGDRKQAIELVGLLVTRDVGSILYFEYVRAHSPEFIKAVGEIAINVRLISELDQYSRQIEVDRFSYDGHFSSRNIKNYYFWSAAYVGQRLRDLGYKSSIVKDLIVSMPHQYKMFAAMQMKMRGLGMGKYPFIDEDRFRSDVYEVIRNSARGNSLSEGHAKANACINFYNRGQ